MAPDQTDRAARLGFHTLPGTTFDAIAAGTESQADISTLAAGEISHRLAVLRAVLDRTRHLGGGPLAPVEAAWALLTRADESDSRATRTVIRHPHAGTWATRLLSRLQGQLHDDVPLWADVGYLHTLAAAAAARAGLAFELAVPTRRGTLIVPTVGSMRIPGTDIWDAVTLSSDGTPGLGGLTVSRAGQPPRPAEWRPPARLRAAFADREVSLVLDDTDPFRRYDVLALPERIGDQAVARWERALSESLTLLTRHHPRISAGLADVVSMIVPLPPAERFRSRSASSGDAFGAVIASFPDDPVDLALTLVHELQHAKLGAILHLVDLSRVDTGLYYAPWRDDPRPLPGLLQGIYAFFGVARFWRRQREVAAGGHAARAHFEFALWREQVDRTVAAIGSSPALTDLGHRFLAGVAVGVSGLLAEPVPASCGELAAMAAADHRATWRAAHLRVDSAAADQLAARWLGSDPPGDLAAASEVTISPRVPAPELDVRAALIRYRLSDRAAFQELGRLEDLTSALAGAHPADLSLVAGRPEEAERQYLAVLGRPLAAPSAWTGLGHALAARGERVASRALLTRPELVSAVAHAVAGRRGQPPPPVALAAWVGSGLATRPKRPGEWAEPPVAEGGRLATRPKRPGEWAEPPVAEGGRLPTRPKRPGEWAEPPVAEGGRLPELG